MTTRLLPLLLGATACIPADPLDLRARPTEQAPAAGATLPADVTAAVEATDVPGEILLAIAVAETGVQMVAGASEFDGQEPAFGIMGLRGEHLELAAALVGEDVELLKTSREYNLLGAAKLLASWAEEEGIDPTDLAAWAPIVARYAGIADEEATAEYVHRQVYRALNDGIELEGYAVAPIDVTADWPLPAIETQRGFDSGAIWTPSPNWNSRSGASVDFVIIHTCEGSYSGCWGWLVNSASGVSAHYVVNETGSEVRALVDENNRAWHISASYDCDNNDGVECWRDGDSMNTISVGIEHAGYASQSSWNSGLISRSAELTCGVTERHDIPRDAYHIVGHGQLQPWDRVDPGANWPWTDYLAQVQEDCGDTGGSTTDPNDGGGSQPTGTSFVIDSNNAANDYDSHYIEVSSSWWSSTNVSGYYNTGYWVGPTAAVSDPASFWFYSDLDQCFKVEAWWTAASDRPAAATFIGWDPDDSEVGRAVVSQKINGGKFNLLGTWEFAEGWNRVLLSRWTTAGAYAVADAVRLTPTTCP